MSKNENTGWYDTVLKAWPKQAGAKPSVENFATAHKLGCRPGKQALAMAMYLRDGGATDGQVKLAAIVQWGSSGSHHNKRRDLVGAGLVKAKPVVSDAQGHKVYAIALTDKGTKKLAAEPKAATEKPAKVTKAKTAKAAKAEPVAVTEPLPGAPAEAQTQPQA